MVGRIHLLSAEGQPTKAVLPRTCLDVCLFVQCLIQFLYFFKTAVDHVVHEIQFDKYCIIYFCSGFYVTCRFCFTNVDFVLLYNKHQSFPFGKFYRIIKDVLVNLRELYIKSKNLTDMC
jgi:hypothetical protein